MDLYYFICFIEYLIFFSLPPLSVCLALPPSLPHSLTLPPSLTHSLPSSPYASLSAALPPSVPLLPLSSVLVTEKSSDPRHLARQWRDLVVVIISGRNARGIIAHTHAYKRKTVGGGRNRERKEGREKKGEGLKGLLKWGI